MTDYQTRSEHEAETFRLFAEALERNRTPVRVFIRSVFICQWSMSLSVRRIKELVEVFSRPDGWRFCEEAVEKELRSLVREKVLRSRVTHGKTRVYEVNY